MTSWLLLPCNNWRCCWRTSFWNGTLIQNSLTMSINHPWAQVWFDIGMTMLPQMVDKHIMCENVCWWSNHEKWPMHRKMKTNCESLKEHCQDICKEWWAILDTHAAEPYHDMSAPKEWWEILGTHASILCCNEKCHVLYQGWVRRGESSTGSQRDRDNKETLLTTSVNQGEVGHWQGMGGEHAGSSHTCKWLLKSEAKITWTHHFSHPWWKYCTWFGCLGYNFGAIMVHFQVKVHSCWCTFGALLVHFLVKVHPCWCTFWCSFGAFFQKTL